MLQEGEWVGAGESLAVGGTGAKHEMSSLVKLMQDKESLARQDGQEEEMEQEGVEGAGGEEEAQVGLGL